MQLSTGMILFTIMFIRLMRRRAKMVTLSAKNYCCASNCT